MHGPEPVPRRVGRAGEGVAVGHVELDGGDLPPLLQAFKQLQRRSDMVRPEVRDHHLHPRVDEGAGDAEADAAGAARDEGDLSFELIHGQAAQPARWAAGKSSRITMSPCLHWRCGEGAERCSPL